MILTPAEYQRIYDQLNSLSDVKRLSDKYPKDFLFVIYTQRTVREATRNFYKIKHKSRKLLRRWRNGESFHHISRSIHYPPVLTAMIIMRESGMSKKRFRSYINNPDLAHTDRLKNELIEIADKDYIYSPKGYDIQRKRGQMGERRIGQWLDDQGITYRTEEDLRQEFPKTPDFLLDDPMTVRGTDIIWIESKASFGDQFELSRQMEKQFKPYKDLFGNGMVIYIYGFIPFPITEGILLETGKFLEEYKG